MTTQIMLKAWGNSQGVLLPKTVIRQLNWNVKDVLELEVNGDEIRIRKPFLHKSFEERLAEYKGQISVCDFDWGEPLGKELV